MDLINSERLNSCRRWSELISFLEDVQHYLKQLWVDIVTVRAADKALDAAQGHDRRQMLESRRLSLTRIAQFYETGQPLFGRYMRFSQTVPSAFWFTQFKRIAAETQRVWNKGKQRFWTKGKT